MTAALTRRNSGLAHRERCSSTSQGRGPPQILPQPSGSSSISGFQPPDPKVTRFHCLSLSTCGPFLFFRNQHKPQDFKYKYIISTKSHTETESGFPSSTYLRTSKTMASVVAMALHYPTLRELALSEAKLEGERGRKNKSSFTL